MTEIAFRSKVAKLPQAGCQATHACRSRDAVTLCFSCVRTRLLSRRTAPSLRSPFPRRDPSYRLR